MSFSRKRAVRRQMQREPNYAEEQLGIMQRALGSRTFSLCLVVGNALDETTCSNCGKSGCAFCVDDMKRCEQCRKVAA